MPRSSRSIAAAVVIAAALAGCPSPGPRPDAGTADAGAPDAGVDAGPPAPAELIVRVELGLPDGGAAELPVEPGGRPTVDPSSDLRVSAAPPLRNYRIRLFDDADKVLPSDDKAENLADHTEYRIHLATPLKPGRRYALVLDAQTGATVEDAQGQPHPDQRIEFQTSGEREKAPAKKSKKHRR